MGGGTSGYDAFISYSHALDGALARALQSGLEQFAKPWYRPRALRVFRDSTSLTANPGLWSSIEKALASSAWLVLMASPEAARSPWVNREVAWWRTNKSPQRLLVVLTEGEFAWDEDTEHGDGATAALPTALRGAFVEEPRWVDLRWLHDVEQVAQSNPRLRECVADVAAAVREVPKDVLVGEHIRQHRRTMRLARGGITALAVMLVERWWPRWSQWANETKLLRLNTPPSPVAWWPRPTGSVTRIRVVPFNLALPPTTSIPAR